MAKTTARDGINAFASRLGRVFEWVGWVLIRRAWAASRKGRRSELFGIYMSFWSIIRDVGVNLRCDGLFEMV